MQAPISKIYDGDVTVKRVKPEFTEPETTSTLELSEPISVFTKRNLKVVGVPNDKINERELKSVIKNEASDSKDKFSLLNVVICLLLLVSLGLSITTIREQRAFTSRLELSNSAMESRFEDLKGSIDSLKEEVNNLSANNLFLPKAEKQSSIEAEVGNINSVKSN